MSKHQGTGSGSQSAGAPALGVRRASAANAVSSPGAPTRDYLAFFSSPLMLPFILIITFVIFIPSTATYFQADDFFQLRGAASTPIWKFIVQALDYRDPRPVPEFIYYRPLFLISFRFWYALFGLNPFGYHLLSIFIHLGSVILVWLIVRRLTLSIAGANFAALVFALHPACTEAVQWVVRALDTGPATLFYLLALLCFMKYLDRGTHRAAYYVASVLGFVVAVLFHTTALTLIAVLPAYAFLIAGEPRDALQRRSWLRFTPFFAITVAMGLIQRQVGLGDYFKVGSFQYSSFGRYLGMALFPVLPDDWSDIGLLSTWRLLDLYFAASLIMIAATLMVLDRRRPPHRGVFAIVWLYTLLAPNTASLVLNDPLTGIIPPQLYLPVTSLGFFFIISAREVRDMLSPTLARRAALIVPPLLGAMFASWILLNLVHEHRDNKFVAENRAFVSELRALSPPSPGSTLYIANPPQNLVIFTDVSLVAAVKLYYGDVHVKVVSAQEAAFIRATDPTQVVLEHHH